MSPLSLPKSKDKDYKFNLAELAEEKGNAIKPQKIGAIPKLAVLLGLLSPQFYDIYNACDGNKDISNLATEFKVEGKQMRINIDKLVKSKMLTI
jgi:hypothetical protein